MKHTICTPSRRFTVQPCIRWGRPAVSIVIDNGKPADLLQLFIEAEQAALLSQAFDIAAEECGCAGINAGAVAVGAIEAREGIVYSSDARQ